MDTPRRCPDAACGNHVEPPAGWFRKRGSYDRADGTAVRRFQCRGCGATFSEATAAKVRDGGLDKRLFGLVCSGMTIRRSALLLGVSVNLVRRHMAVLAERAREAHADALACYDLDSSEVQFDEQETFLHARCQPLTIALVVRAEGQILSAKVGRIPAKGRLAATGQARGWVVNHGPRTRAAALREAAPCIEQWATVVCDGAPSYPNEIRAALGGKKVFIDAKRSRAGTGGFDPLFKLNHVCAKIRADLACMARDTWTTTKSIPHLQDRLDLYIAWNNGYPIV